MPRSDTVWTLLTHVQAENMFEKEQRQRLKTIHRSQRVASQYATTLFPTRHHTLKSLTLRSARIGCCPRVEILYLRTATPATPMRNERDPRDACDSCECTTTGGFHRAKTSQIKEPHTVCACLRFQISSAVELLACLEVVVPYAAIFFSSFLAAGDKLFT